MEEMSYIVRDELVAVEYGLEFICTGCGTSNEIDEEDTVFTSVQCWSCLKIINLRDGFATLDRGKGKAWTQDQLRYVILNYPDQRCEDVAKVLGRSTSSVYQLAARFSLEKTKRFTDNVWKPKNKVIAGGEAHRFRKGHTPHNKGKRFVAGGRSHETRFGPGHLPHNAKTDGYISVRVHKRTGIPYKWIRLSINNWQQLHKHTWEEANGPVPEGHIVVFRDRNTMNCNLDNLECISRAENMRRNTIHRYPEDVKKNIRLVGKLNRKIKKIEDA